MTASLFPATGSPVVGHPAIAHRVKPSRNPIFLLRPQSSNRFADAPKLVTGSRESSTGIPHVDLDDLYRLTAPQESGQNCTYPMDATGNLAPRHEVTLKSFTLNAADRCALIQKV